MFFCKVKSHFVKHNSNRIAHNKPEIKSQGKSFHKATEVADFKTRFDIGDKWGEANHVVKHAHDEDFVGELHSSFEIGLKVICFCDDYDCGYDRNYFEEYLHPKEVPKDYNNYCHQKSSKHEIDRVNQNTWTFLKREFAEQSAEPLLN